MKHSLKMLTVAFAVIGIIATGARMASPAFGQIQARESQKKSGPMPTPVAKVTPVQAMDAAEAKVGGKATMVLFEYDGRHWVYGVIVVKNNKLMEVDVDPANGKAGATEDVTPHEEAKEFGEALAKMLH